MKKSLFTYIQQLITSNTSVCQDFFLINTGEPCCSHCYVKYNIPCLAMHVATHLPLKISTSIVQNQGLSAHLFETPLKSCSTGTLIGKNLCVSRLQSFKAWVYGFKVKFALLLQFTWKSILVPLATARHQSSASRGGSGLGMCVWSSNSNSSPFDSPGKCVAMSSFSIFFHKAWAI